MTIKLIITPMRASTVLRGYCFPVASKVKLLAIPGEGAAGLVSLLVEFSTVVVLAVVFCVELAGVVRFVALFVVYSGSWLVWLVKSV